METAVPLVCLAGAMLLIRVGWSGQRRLAVAGWALAAVVLGWLAQFSGAWGLATGLTAGAIFALVLVFHAGAVSPQRTNGKASTNPAVRLPSGEKGLARRLLVFLVVVPMSFFAAQWLAFAISLAMRGNGPLDANSVAMMLLIQPTVWAALMAWQMVLHGPRQMLVPPAAIAAIATAIWIFA